MNFQTMSKQRKFILIAAAIGVIAMFLPWITVSFLGFSRSENGMHGNGILVFLSLLGAGAVAFLGDQTKNLEKTFWFVALACGALATLIMIYNLIDVGSAISYLSFGFYLVILASVGVLLSAYMYRNPTDSIKGGFDSLKKDIEDKTKSSTP
jgi:peptidoglycan/LPS O-acetylase OafA/YrhL